MVLILSRRDIEPLLNMGEIINIIEMAFLESDQGKTVCPTRAIINVGKHKGFMYYMPSYLSESESLAIKIVSQYDENLPKYGVPTIMASILLNDPQTGRLLAIMEGGYLTALRTGAASGVAAKYLARRDSKVVGVIGTGVQARTQIWAMTEVLRNIAKVKAYDVSPGRVEGFAKDISQKLGLDVETVETSKQCVENSDLIVVASTSRVPVLDGNWLTKGAHVNSIGVSGPEGRELDDTTIKKAKIVVDTKEGVLAETGDLIVPIKRGVISQENIYAELHEIVGGKKPGRTSDDEVTCWKAVGMAIEDAAVAKLVYDKAKKEGIGKEVEI
jgi:ornithine cyclodeaminase/alanine dehydrogenase